MVQQDGSGGQEGWETQANNRLEPPKQSLLERDTPSPFKLVSSVPKQKLKTCNDCWEGYHSVKLREEDRDKTTFITQWGRFRYITLPQGHSSAQDGYTRRYDDVLKDVPDIIKIIDDTMQWADNIEEAFWATAKFLSLCSQNGVILNPPKFKFAEETVEFAGFNITMDSILPSDTLMKDIKNFPAPSNISEVRSFYGLVNQCSYAFTASKVMQPFRHLLKPSTIFQWTEELQEAFVAAKQNIVEQVMEGIKIFEVGRHTCLATDWCHSGIGFILFQKHCTCSIIKPDCCKGGWKVTLVGGRFTNTAESRYSPTEGECLAVVDSLKHAKYYVLGCPKLLVATDHKPLVEILGSKGLADIDNPRLFRLKEKTMSYNFNIIYIPGKEHLGPDAMSRMFEKSPTAAASWVSISYLGSRPGGRSRDKRLLTDKETAVMASLSTVDIEVNAITNLGARVVSLKEVRKETDRDGNLQQLAKYIMSEFPDNPRQLEEELLPYYKLRHDLSITDRVVAYKGRIIIPTALRQQTLANIHGAHQGTTGMMARADDAVFWPGISQDIIRSRSSCITCDRIAPSNPSCPPTAPPCPDYPFQLQAGDYFAESGHTYLALVDRFSGWLSLYYCGPEELGSKSLVEKLKIHFSTFGIPDEFSSDGAKVFVSEETEQFLRNWGVEHRLSSAYYPHANSRAELGVKAAKRLVRDNAGPGGTVHSDKVLRALMQYRNTPVPDLRQSPSQIIFGRCIRDFLPVLPYKYSPRKEWLIQREDRERALAQRYRLEGERLARGTKHLPPIKPGTTVAIQNQHGPCPTRWDKTGLVVEALKHEQYRVKVHGSGRVTLRNRKFLRIITPYKDLPGIRPVPVLPEPTPALIEPVPSHPSTGQQPQQITPETPPIPAMGSSTATDPITPTWPPSPTSGIQIPILTTPAQAPIIPSNQTYEQPTPRPSPPSTEPATQLRPSRTIIPNKRYPSSEYDLSRLDTNKAESRAMVQLGDILSTLQEMISRIRDQEMISRVSDQEGGAGDI